MSKEANTNEKKKRLKILLKLPNGEIREVKSDDPDDAHDGTANELATFLKLREDHANRREAHRTQIRADVCSAYKFGRRLMENDDLWAVFQKADWKEIGQPDERDQTDAVRYAIKFMVGPGKDAQKKASFYFRAIKKFAETSASVSEVKKALKKHGFRVLAKKGANVAEDEGSELLSEERNVPDDEERAAGFEGKGSKNMSARASTKTEAASTATSVEGVAGNGQWKSEGNSRHLKTLSLGWTDFVCSVKLSSKALKLARMTEGQELDLSCTFIASPPTLHIKSVRNAEEY